MTIITSARGELIFGSGHPTVIASMLINTLNNETLTQALIRGDFDEVKRLAEKQSSDGVGMLQIMVAHPEINEEHTLPKACLAAHEASGLPLYIDTANPSALQRTLDAFPYKPLLSVSAETSRMQAILPLTKASGAAVICLCMDGAGIPNSPEERFAIGERLIKEARAIGIPDDNLVIDPLIMATGVCEPEDILVPVDVLRMVKEQYGFSTFLGIDNAGFGMPKKDIIDLAFLLAAIPAGLDVALLEPPLYSLLGTGAVDLLFAANFISGRDPYAKQYLNRIRRLRKSNKS